MRELRLDDGLWLSARIATLLGEIETLSNDAGKWRRTAPLKSRWYDDHEANDARDTIENRVRALDERLLKSDEEEVRSGDEVARFFDLFEPRGS
jgi:hypothetical protein